MKELSEYNLILADALAKRAIKSEEAEEIRFIIDKYINKAFSPEVLRTDNETGLFGASVLSLAKDAESAERIAFNLCYHIRSRQTPRMAIIAEKILTVLIELGYQELVFSKLKSIYFPDRMEEGSINHEVGIRLLNRIISSNDTFTAYEAMLYKLSFAAKDNDAYNYILLIDKFPTAGAKLDLIRDLATNHIVSDACFWDRCLYYLESVGSREAVILRNHINEKFDLMMVELKLPQEEVTIDHGMPSIRKNKEGPNSFGQRP